MAFTWVLILCLATVQVNCEYYSKTVPHHPQREKETHLHFFLNDTLSGDKPTAVIVAHANLTANATSPTPFSTVVAIDDRLTDGVGPDSEVIGNARGLYVSSSQDDKLTIVMYLDFGFTTGPFNGSSIVVVSRNPVTEMHREVAVVGGRRKFRMAKGFANLKTHYFNTINGDAVIEYNVTVIHY